MYFCKIFRDDCFYVSNGVQVKMSSGSGCIPNDHFLPSLFKESSVPWCGIAVTLGTLCLLLLVTTAVLGTKSE